MRCGWPLLLWGLYLWLLRQAGRPAVRMQQLAGAQAQECCVCCLNSGLSQWRPGGLEGRKLMHVYIVELSVGPPPLSNALLFKHSQVLRWPHWCRCSQLCLHPTALCLNVCLNNEDSATTLFPTVGVWCFNLEAWMVDKKVLQGSLYHTEA